jgi:hypothetical protein
LYQKSQKYTPRFPTSEDQESAPHFLRDKDMYRQIAHCLICAAKSKPSRTKHKQTTANLNPCLEKAAMC